MTGAGFLDVVEMRRAVALAEVEPASWQLALALAEAAQAALWAEDPDAPDLAARALDLARVTSHPRALSFALTANAMAHQVAEYLGAGMDGFVPKPIEVARLFEALQQALDGDAAVEAA